LHEIQLALLADIAVLGEYQSLDAELHAFRIVGPLGDMGPLASLVVDGGDHIAFALDQVHLRDQAQPVGRQGDGAGVIALFLLGAARLGQVAGGTVHAAVAVAALHRVSRIRPLGLDPFQIGEPRAVLVLVDHARR